MAEGDYAGGALVDEILDQHLDLDGFKAKLKQLHAKNPVIAYWACRTVCFALFLELECESIQLGLAPTLFCNRAQGEEFKRRRTYGQLLTTKEYNLAHCVYTKSSCSKPN